MDVNKIKDFGSKFEQTLLSLVKIPLMSRGRSPLPRDLSNADELVILANGPSLNKTVETQKEFLDSRTLMAVNFCATSSIYTELRPEIYLIADPLFWIVDEKMNRLFGALAQKTTWPIHFFIPYKANKKPQWKNILKDNGNIKIHYYNTTPIEGFDRFTDMVYKSGLGMPRPHNVLIPAIAVALRMSFKKIYLAGADHSWLPEIVVTDNNEVLMNQKHFYDHNTSSAQKVSKEDLSSSNLHTILYHMHVAFKSYFVLQRYALKMGKEVINITPGSFIDAFPRLKL